MNYHILTLFPEMVLEGLNTSIIGRAEKKGLIYESRHYHNIVFKGNNKDGVTKFASICGVVSGR